MIVEFRMKNFRSFRDEQVFSMVASADTALETNTCTVGGMSLLKCAGVFGANASGKSNFVAGLKFMQSFIKRSTALDSGQTIPVEPFLLDSCIAKAPSEFELTFFCDGTRYQYGFSLSREAVEAEWLLAYPRGKAQRWFERDRNAGEPWRFGANLKGPKVRLQEMTRPDALFLSVGAKFNNEQLLSVHAWLTQGLRILDLSRVAPAATGSLGVYTASRSEKDSDFKQRVLSLLREADLGIDGFVVDREPWTPEEGLEPYFKASYLDAVKGVEVTKPRILHNVSGVEEQVSFDLTDESNGTQRLFALAGPWLDTLDNGYVLVVDEFQTCMHPLITRHLIRMVQDSGKGSEQAQVVFATHDVTLMDSSLFRRDQLWFAEKDRSGASHLYSLYDIRKKPRKTEAWQKNYLAGRYGGVPILEGDELE